MWHDGPHRTRESFPVEREPLAALDQTTARLIANTAAALAAR